MNAAVDRVITGAQRISDTPTVAEIRRDPGAVDPVLAAEVQAVNQPLPMRTRKPRAVKASRADELKLAFAAGAASEREGAWLGLAVWGVVFSVPAFIAGALIF